MKIPSHFSARFVPFFPAKMPGVVARLVILLSGLGLQPPAAIADSWKFDPVEKSRTETYGNIRIVQTVDGRENVRYPDFILSIHSGDQLLARYKGVRYQQLFAAPDHSLFVGLSNNGLPGTAVVVFDNRGNLLLEVKHGAAAFDYCDKSMTLVRRWYDDEKPDVQFIPDKEYGGYKAITVRDCKGKTEDLQQLVLRAWGNALRQATQGSGR
jgi:hypothetical protein